MIKKQYNFKYNKGFSLVELMVASVIGLIVILAVISVFLATQKTVKITNALGDIQESSRITFQLMAKDIRSAHGNPCSSSLDVVNILNSRNSPWWNKWKAGLYGYDDNINTFGTPFGNSYEERLSGSDAIDIYSAQSNVSNILKTMTNKSSPITIYGDKYKTGDIVLICDPGSAFIFQISGVTVGSNKEEVNHNSIYNCSSVFSLTDPCNSGAMGHKYSNDALISKVLSVRWYIGKNNNGGYSLFRSEMKNTTNTLIPNKMNTVEIARNVTNMQILYKQNGSNNYVSASSISNWNSVVSVRVELTFSALISHSAESQLGNDGKHLTKTMTQTIMLRNK